MTVFPRGPIPVFPKTITYKIHCHRDIVVARQRSNCYLTLLVQRTIPPQSHLYSNRYHHPRIARTGRAVLDRTGIDYYLSKSGKPTVMGRNLYAAFPHETSVAVRSTVFPIRSRNSESTDGLMIKPPGATSRTRARRFSEV